MEPKFVKDDEFEEKLASLLREGGVLNTAGANTKEANYVLTKLLRDNAYLKDELHSCRKRLQRLETAWKHGNVSEKAARGRKGGGSGAPSKGKANSVGKGKTRENSNSKSVRFESASENSSTVNKSNNSNKSNKSKKKGTTTRIKLWKALPEDKKKDLRKEENLAYKKVPSEKWQSMTTDQRTVISTERKLRIQKFQEKCTAIALSMAEKKAKDRESRKAEEVGKLMEDGKAKQGGPGTSGRPPPSGKYTTQTGGPGSGRGMNSPPNKTSGSK